jgi:hypothetical protein
LMPSMREIWSQPTKFLSYFISPEPPIDHFEQTNLSVAFDLPISSEMFPYTTQYLVTAFEQLPVYIRQPPAKGDWQGIRLRLDWTEYQNDFFSDTNVVPHQMSPDLLRSVVETLGKLGPNEIGSNNYKAIDGQVDTEAIRKRVAQLSDYLLRAGQMTKILLNITGKNPESLNTIKKLQWDRALENFPEIVREINLLLDQKNVDELQKKPLLMPSKEASKRQTQQQLSFF